MSLFQCSNCGCCENTALSGYTMMLADNYDWTGIESLIGMDLCSECGPDTYCDGEPSGLGEWHGQFNKVMLPLGMFKTNKDGNLEHIETGSIDFRKYAI